VVAWVAERDGDGSGEMSNAMLCRICSNISRCEAFDFPGFWGWASQWRDCFLDEREGFEMKEDEGGKSKASSAWGVGCG
jgi:hypothetical protein